MNLILGIGELLWDVYPDGRKVAGGAPFNFAFHCHQLGHPSVVVSRVGDDDLGRELREEVRRLGLSDEYIQTDREHPTGTVRVTLDENKVPSYEIAENVAWDHIEWNESLNSLRSEDSASRLTGIGAVCFGTLAQRSPTSRSTIMRFVGSAKLRVFDVNLRQGNVDRDLLQQSMQLSDWIKVNDEELERISQRANSAMWIVTRGADGVDLRLPGKCESLSEPAVPANVVDTVGAGDAFTAALVCLHLEGRPLRECARFANHYAARVCEQQGATPKLDRTTFGGR